MQEEILSTRQLERETLGFEWNNFKKPPPTPPKETKMVLTLRSDIIPTFGNDMRGIHIQDLKPWKI